jgi:malonyl-ACP O-methyltransferase BioC/dethiobiotin synthase
MSTHSADRNRRIARRFERAASHYEAHAGVQRETAGRLADRIAALPLPRHPRILEIGCGTGLLTRAVMARIGPAEWTLTDIAAPMLAAARAALEPCPGIRFLQMDGEYPSAECGAGYDLICASLAVQWFADLDAGLARLCGLLAPGGHLAIATLGEHTFQEWREAHERHGHRAAPQHYPPASRIGLTLPGVQGGVQSELLRWPHASGLDFLRSLRGIGATSAGPDHRPLSAPALRQVLHTFDTQGACVTYDLAFGHWRKTAENETAETAENQAPVHPAPRGAFVTGTDTGVGKTLVSAILARAWKADYWKPLQTGLDEEAGDTDTVARLAALPPERIHAPAFELQAPLAPWAAAALEHRAMDARALNLPATLAPLVVEGAGGLYVPIDDHHMMIDLIARLGLPVVLVARSGLGTINHTLLSLHALRQRGIAVLGVVMSGAPNAGNRVAIERFGQVRVLLEIPLLEVIDAAAVATLAASLPAPEGWPSGY